MSIAARRAIVRWSWRMFRREWRQQLLVLLLLTLTVAGSVFGAAAAYNLAPDSDSMFGSGSHVVNLSSEDPAAVTEALQTLEDRFGPIDVIRLDSVAVPGSTSTIVVRSQDPHGPLGAPMLARRDGRYPRGTEVALTPDVARRLDARIGDEVHLGRADHRVVGIVENPADLGLDFALVAPDQDLPEVAVLVDTTDDQLRDLHLDAMRGVGVRGNDQNAVAAVAALALGVVVSILVCLVAAAGFVVIAQRRLRQLGMLAAIGADRRHLRWVVVANGVFVGLIVAVAGAALAVAGWLLASPLLESAAGHRLDRFDLPWWIIATGMGLALATATIAAWWPGRAVARVAVVEALSARPPAARPVHRSALSGLLLAAAGFAGLAIGLDPTKEEANALLVLPAMAALVIGMLLLSPLVIRAVGALAGRAPVALRIALRDLSRNQARSGIALAAIALALGLAVTVVVVASAAADAPDEGNLAADQLLVRTGHGEPAVPILDDATLKEMEAGVDQVAEAVHGTVVPLSVAINPDAQDSVNGVAERPYVMLARPVGDVFRDVGPLYVATPEVLDAVRIDPDSLDGKADVLTPRSGSFVYANTMGRPPDLTSEPIDAPILSSAPSSLITEAAVAEHGWEAAPAGWLIQAPAPITPGQRAEAQDVAAQANIAVEARDAQEGLQTVKTAATIAGSLLALAIMAMTIGLLRGETANEVRTLAATGASTRTRRTIVAATAGVLGLAGVLLGTVGAYLALIASYLEDLDQLSAVPIRELLVIIVGIPIVAAAAAWLLGGREPPMTRPALE